MLKRQRTSSWLIVSRLAVFGGRSTLVALIVIAFNVFALGQRPGWKDLLSKPEHEVATLIDVKVPMRDGVKLSGDVYLPTRPGKWPVILERTPYNNSGEWYVNRARYFAQRGYVYVLEDVRGRYDSEGEWNAWFNEINDGRDTLDWCGTQPWSSGNVGMNGMSYMGLVQWLAAPTGSPYLKTIIPQMASADFYLYGMNYTGGAFQLHINLPWAINTSSRTMQNSEAYDWDRLFRHLPILTSEEAATGRQVGFYRDWVRHSSYDDFWKKISNYGKFQRMDLPILQIAGWWDIHGVSLFANYDGIQREGTERARRLQKVVMGPWVHTDKPERKYGVLDFGVDSVMDLYELWLRWMDHWLKGIDNGMEEEPPLKLFVMGINRWRNAERWPLPDTRFASFYLHSDGRANSLFGKGGLSEEKPKRELPDSYAYDPENPVPLVTGIKDGSHPPADHRPIERRDDVLVYTSEPLEEDLEVTGPIQAHVWASSSARDTDWTARLLDVHPDARSLNLCEGILRARFRESFERPALLSPGTTYEFTIKMGVTSNAFLKGHRIRLEVSSSNFPRFDRNLNNGGDLGVDPQIVVAKQTIYHDEEHSSDVLLPVVPLQKEK
jgi:putative CocE/NonD family hydrolase